MSFAHSILDRVKKLISVAMIIPLIYTSSYRKKQILIALINNPNYEQIPNKLLNTHLVFQSYKVKSLNSAKTVKNGFLLAYKNHSIKVQVQF